MEELGPGHIEVALRMVLDLGVRLVLRDKELVPREYTLAYFFPTCEVGT